MKNIKLIFVLLLNLVFISVNVAADEPVSTESEMWQYIINNAFRTLDNYAIENNPNAVFIGANVKTDFIKQYSGAYEGRYLLKIVNESGGNISFAMLLPLFDEYASSENLDDEGDLWKIVSAKYNGRDF